MPFHIIKSSRIYTGIGYEGPTCALADVAPGKLYRDYNRAVIDAKTLKEFNSVGFHVVNVKTRQIIPMPKTVDYLHLNMTLGEFYDLYYKKIIHALLFDDPAWVDWMNVVTMALFGKENDHQIMYQLVNLLQKNWDQSLLPKKKDLIILPAVDKKVLLHTRYRRVTAFVISSFRETFGDFQEVSKPKTISLDMIRIAEDPNCIHAVLADAAEDAGYTDKLVLDHLRLPIKHKNCWAVRALLGQYLKKRV
jgi:hypothetical protein